VVHARDRLAADSRVPRTRAWRAFAVGCVALIVGACASPQTTVPSATVPSATAPLATPPPATAPTTTVPTAEAAFAINLHAVATRDGVEIVGVGGAAHSRDKRLAVVRTPDNGATWTSWTVDTPALESLTWSGDRLIGATRCVPEHDYDDTYQVHVQESFPTACLYVSADHGMTWAVLAGGRMVDPTFVDDLHGWARAPSQLAETALYATEDGGLTWNSSVAPCPEDRPAIASVSLVAPGAGYVLCKTATYERSPGGGWRANPSSLEDWIIAEIQLDGTVALRAGGHTDLQDNSAIFVRDITMRADGSGLATGKDLLVTTDHAQALERQSIASASVTGVGGHGTLLEGRAAILVAAPAGNEPTIGIASTTDGVDWTMLGQWPWSPW
jgi:hypothetical protein